ncbi:LacI family DNA-binding transcriptional regulator [Occultella aeris]|uniref:Catabolite control protein A n=1 Tax=Occultella aeris TaxID=2761496 RepID=A0A7M4DP31_9MICO|nr:substrate-binding domain-containing protein [Occultella aeris]VZO39217.1 Catabolite control protein A [Occultella aeris]
MPTVTLAQVAERAGVTVPTASKVLNGRTDVSAATRARVLAAVAETGYRSRRAHGAARADDESGLIDLVISGVEGTWANRALSGVEFAANLVGLDVVVTVARPAADRDWAARLVARRSSGAVLALVEPTPEQYAALDVARIPVVILDPRSEPPAAVPSVGAGNWAGGRAAAQHLLELGHRHLGVIAGAPDHLYGRARVDGFGSALREHGLEVRDADVVHADWSYAGALGAAMRLLDRPDRPSAVFACSDNMALGALEAARRLGVRVPGAMSVIGYDDAPEARWTSPQLTTIRQPVAEMGAAALRMLLRVRGGADTFVGDGHTPREELATRLVARGSTASWPTIDQPHRTGKEDG